MNGAAMSTAKPLTPEEHLLVDVDARLVLCAVHLQAIRGLLTILESDRTEIARLKKIEARAKEQLDGYASERYRQQSPAVVLAYVLHPLAGDE